MKIPVSKPYVSNQCEQEIWQAVKAKEVSGNFGDYIPKFENKFASFCGTKHAISCSNGTTALHLCLLAAGIKCGDEVLISDTTNMATFFAAEYVGAKIIPVDICKDSYTIDPRDLEAKITSKTKALICVHLFGQLCDMQKIVEIAKRNSLIVIEDCAEAHGAEFFGKKAGSFGDLGAFSFFSNKLLTSGEGGAVTTNSDRYAKKIRSLKSLSFGEKNKFIHKDIGFNYRMTNIQCAFAYSQTKQADKIINRRIELCREYLKHLKVHSKLVKFPIERKNFKNVFWMMHCELQGHARGKRQEMFDYMKHFGVELREGFVPYTAQTYHNLKFQPTDCAVSYSCFENTFYFPTFNDMTNQELLYVVGVFNDWIKEITC